jgi:hypothetical protein
MKNIAYILLAVSLIFTACTKNNDELIVPATTVTDNSPKTNTDTVAINTNVINPNTNTNISTTTITSTTVNIIGKILDVSGQPLAGFEVQCVTTKSSKKITAISDKQGQFQMTMATNEAATLSVYCEHRYDNMLKTVSLPAYQNNTTLDNIVVDDITLIKGRIVDCLGTPMTNGHIGSLQIQQTVNIQADGTFSYAMPCSSTQSGTITLKVNIEGRPNFIKSFKYKPGLVTELGDIQLCNIAPYNSQIYVKYDGKDYYYNQNMDYSDAGSLHGISLYFEKQTPTDIQHASFWLDSGVKLNEPTKFVAFGMGTHNDKGEVLQEIVDCENCMTVIVTENIPNKELKGTFSGTTKDGKPISGSFYAKKVI